MKNKFENQIIVVSEYTPEQFEVSLNEAFKAGYMPSGNPFTAMYQYQHEIATGYETRTKTTLNIVMVRMPQQPAVQMFRGPIPQA